MNEKPPARLWAYGLDRDTRQSLRRVGEIVIPHLDEILERFYEDITQTPDWFAFFDTPKLKEHARSKQKEHWVNMFSCDYTQDYFKSAETVGRVHFKIGLPLRHFVGSYARVAASLQKLLAVEAPPRFSFRRVENPYHLVDALSRALLLDIELAITGFQDAQTEAFEARMNELAATFEADIGTMAELMTSTMRELDLTAAGMDDEIGGARRGTGTVSVNARDIATSAHSVAAAIEQLSASINSINHDVSQAAKASGQAAGDSEATAAQVETLQTAVEEIGEVVTLIAGIARQTNLLAVNATVEAARAGDAGKGFAVVAHEVKALALRIAEATDSIGDRIERIQGESQQMASRMEGIGKSVEQVRTYSESIRVAVEEQKQAAHHLAQHAESTAANTNEMADILQEVSARVDRSGDSSNMLRQGVGRVAGEAESLSERVRRFLSAMKAA